MHTVCDPGRAAQLQQPHALEQQSHLISVSADGVLVFFMSSPGVSRSSSRSLQA